MIDRDFEKADQDNSLKKQAFLIIPCILLILLGMLMSKKEEGGKFYTEIPVRFFPFKDRPIISLTIENQTYRVLVDLGSSHPLDLQKRALNKLKKKKNLGLSHYKGIRGNRYEVQQYLLPEMQFNRLKIQNVSGFEESPHFLKDAKTWKSSGWIDAFKDYLENNWIDGRVGWNLFKQGISLFDFAGNRLILAKDRETLFQEAPYSLDDFMLIPLEIHDWGITIQLDTDHKKQTFLLDTGATQSILKKTSSPLVLQKLGIGSQNFGPWKFTPFAYSDFFACDGILGIDFFKKHTICLDFSEKVILLKKNRTTKKFEKVQ